VTGAENLTLMTIGFSLIGLMGSLLLAIWYLTARFEITD